MTYLEELWTELSEEERNFVRHMQDALPDTPSLITPAVLSPSGEVVPCDMPTLFVWQLKHSDRIRVAKSFVRKIEVSTVFLPYARSLHFETMLFKKSSSKTWRWKTIEEAKAGHDLIVSKLVNNTLD